MTNTSQAWQPKASVMRYVIPFRLEHPNDVESSYAIYEKACDHFDLDNRWTSKNALSVQEDLYDHIISQMSPLTKGYGRSWLLKTPGNGKLDSFSFIATGRQTVHFDMTAAGAFLFSTAIGFLWYEITPKSSGSEFSIDTLLRFQNRFKELAQSSARIVENGLAPSNPQLTDKCLRSILIPDWDSFQSYDKQDPASYVELLYVKSCSNGNGRLNDTVRNVSRQQLADLINRYQLSWELTRTGTVPRLTIAQLQNDDGNTEYRLYPVFHPTKALCDKLPDQILTLMQYFSSVTRSIPGRDLYHPESTRPDKSLPFCYLQADIADRIELQQLACRMSKGYHSHYHLSQSMWNDCIELFDNAFFHAGREGCSYVNMQENASHPFFDSGFQFRFRSVYFLLYILVLHQHYGLLNYSRRISLELSSNPDEYLLSGPVSDRMKALLLEINTFLLKSECSSVSNLQHHNTFYQYIRRQLSIEADVASLKSGLDALTEIQHSHQERQERIEESKQAQANMLQDRKTQRALGTLSALTVFSAFGDSQASVTGLIEQLKAIVPFEDFPVDFVSLAITAALWIVVWCVGGKAISKFFRAYHGESEDKK